MPRKLKKRIAFKQADCENGTTTTMGMVTRQPCSRAFLSPSHIPAIATVDENLCLVGLASFVLASALSQLVALGLTFSPCLVLFPRGQARALGLNGMDQLFSISQRQAADTVDALGYDWYTPAT